MPSKPLKSKDLKKVGNDERIYTKFEKQVIKELSVYDHQGHIIPQNMIASAIIMDKIFTDYFNEEALDKDGFLQNYNQSNISEFLSYEDAKASFPEDETTIDMLTTMLSRIIWNPGNICRAPSDDQRAGYPGENIDEEVITKLEQTASDQANQIKAAKKAIEDKKPKDFFKAWKELLSAYQGDKKLGYYQFEWMWKDPNAQPKVAVPA